MEINFVTRGGGGVWNKNKHMTLKQMLGLHVVKTPGSLLSLSFHFGNKMQDCPSVV